MVVRIFWKNIGLYKVEYSWLNNLSLEFKFNQSDAFNSKKKQSIAFEIELSYMINYLCFMDFNSTFSIQFVNKINVELLKI